MSPPIRRSHSPRPLRGARRAGSTRQRGIAIPTVSTGALDSTPLSTRCGLRGAMRRGRSGYAEWSAEKIFRPRIPLARSISEYSQRILQSGRRQLIDREQKYARRATAFDPQVLGLEQVDEPNNPSIQAFPPPRSAHRRGPARALRGGKQTSHGLSKFLEKLIVVHRTREHWIVLFDCQLLLLLTQGSRAVL